MTPKRRRELEAAYLDADYWVQGPAGRFVIRIGEPCRLLDELLRGEQATNWAYVTACNPHSRRLSDEDNAIRMHHLVADLSIAGRRFYPGEGQARDGSWPPEPSLLILDMGAASAGELARRYGQLAIVAGKAGEIARLVWVDSDTTTTNQSN